MIQATARVLKNIIELRVGDEQFVGRPVQAEQAGLGHRIAALFSTEFHVVRPTTPLVVEATVSYRAKTDEIRMRIGEETWRTQATTFGPMTIDYGGVRYTINERLTGKFAIVNGAAPVGVGSIGFRTCTIDEYPPELGMFLGYLALGYVIRHLTWQMLG
ncbi:MAG TPA: hypothetical protein VML94_00500 [Thermoplasmata archaeon]|nr:hypothetical protein [Thermoplasmata archaeon]